MLILDRGAARTSSLPRMAVVCGKPPFTVFMQLSHKIGLRRPGERTGPRIHDFRHRFAIRTLVGWYREGTDVENKLPALSTYLGHTCVQSTYWYLSAYPDLLQEAARRLDRRW